MHVMLVWYHDFAQIFPEFSPGIVCVCDLDKIIGSLMTANNNADLTIMLALSKLYYLCY